MEIIQPQSNRGLPIVNVTSTAVNFSTPSIEYIGAEQNQFILSKTDDDILLIPVNDNINFTSTRYNLEDIRISSSMCILRKKKEGSESKSNRITSAYALRIPESKYKLVRLKTDKPIVLKYQGRSSFPDITVDIVYKLVEIKDNLVTAKVDFTDEVLVSNIEPRNIINFIGDNPGLHIRDTSATFVTGLNIHQAQALDELTSQYWSNNLDNE